MPTYEYQCSKCGYHFEKFQSITARRVRTCPECKGKVNRLPGTGAGIIFKGNGFYETDYRSKGYRESQKKETAVSSESKNDKKETSKDSSGAGTKSKNTKE